jgi:hypothetical protein
MTRAPNSIVLAVVSVHPDEILDQQNKILCSNQRLKALQQPTMKILFDEPNLVEPP